MATACRPIRLFAVAALATLLGACGFQLRGTTALPVAWQQLHLSSPSPNSELAQEVQGRLRSSGVEWVARKDANFVIELSNEQFEQRSLSVGAQVRAAEFELVLSVEYAIYDRAGRQVRSPDTARVTALVENDPQNIVGKTDEIRMLREELRGDLVQQIVRQISFAANVG